MILHSTETAYQKALKKTGNIKISFYKNTATTHSIFFVFFVLFMRVVSVDVSVAIFLGGVNIFRQNPKINQKF